MGTGTTFRWSWEDAFLFLPALQLGCRSEQEGESEFVGDASRGDHYRALSYSYSSSHVAEARDDHLGDGTQLNVVPLPMPMPLPNERIGIAFAFVGGSDWMTHLDVTQPPRMVIKSS